MSGRLAGKVAVLTAAGAGIGRATAEAFIREGARVVATDIALEALDGLDADRRRLDVRSGDEVAALAGALGPIDALFNCAGFVHHGSVLECSDEDWDFSFDLNVKSMHRTIRAFLPGMLEKGGGSIVNMASAASSVKGVPNRYVYGASKAAVIGLTKAVAADVIRKGVRCNAICPGTVESPSLESRIARARPRIRPVGRGGAAVLRRPAADGPARQARGSGRARRLSRLRRERLHHRTDPPRRRRLVDVAAVALRLPFVSNSDSRLFKNFGRLFRSSKYNIINLLLRTTAPSGKQPAQTITPGWCAAPAWFPRSR